MSSERPSLSFVNLLSSEAEETEGGIKNFHHASSTGPNRNEEKNITMASEDDLPKYQACAAKASWRSSTSTETVREVIDNLNSEQRIAVTKLGFGSLLNLQALHEDGQFLFWLVNNFNCERRTLDIHGCCIKVMTEDVEHVLGLSANGVNIAALEKDWYTDDLLEQELHITVKDGEVVLAHLKKSLLFMQTSGVEFKVKFALLVIGKILAPRSDILVKRTFIPFLHEVDLIEHMNWAKFVLDKLVIGIRNAQMMKDEQVDGCVVFLMLFYMEHFSIHGDAYIPLHIRAKPRVQFWGNDRLQRRISRLKHLGVMDGIEVEVIADDSVWYIAQHGEESQNCKLGKRMNEVEDSTRDLKEEYKEIRDSMCSMAQSLQTMQDVIVSEMKRFIERVGDKEATAISLGEGNGNAVNSKNGVCKNYVRKYKPKCNPVCFKEPIAWNILPQTENQDNDLTSRFVEYERDTSIDVTSPVKVDNVEVVAEKEASLRVSSMDDKLPRKTCINKALGLANPDSEVSSTGSVKARLLNMTRQGAVTKHKIQISPASKRLFKKKNASPKPKKARCCKKRKQPCNGDNPDCPIEIGDNSTRDGELPPETRARLIDLLFDNRLPRYTTLVSMLGQKATRSQLRSLRPGRWIHAEVLSCYSALLTLRGRRDLKGSRRVWYLPAYLEQLILHDTIRPEGIYGNYLTESSFGGPIAECEKICLPMNWNKEHWYLCIIDIISREVFICDSAPDSDAVNNERENNAKIVCAAIEEALSYGFGRGHKGDVNNYKFTRSENCPKQGNGNDCGVYIAKFMEHCGDVKAGFKLHVTSLDRLRIAFDLFLDLANEVRHLCVYDFAGLENLFG